MKNKSIHWFEAKQLDRVTNYSSRTEIIRNGLINGLDFHYYCSFAKTKKYFGFAKNIHYLGIFKNKILKKIEFNLLVLFNTCILVLKRKDQIIILNQDLIKISLPSLMLNRLFRRKNKYVVDIRTTPTAPESFETDMSNFHSKFRYAVKYFDGLSFITEFMEKYVMKEYAQKKPTVNWSSGVDCELFDLQKYLPQKKGERFTIFYHGGISESRGNLNLVKACEKLIGLSLNIELVQVGISVDPSIQEYINANRLNSWCKLLAPVALEEIPQLIANADLPVLPFPNFMAWRVSSPIKLMEYLSMGKKVLAPDMEAFTDVFNGNDELVFYFDTNAADPVAEIAEAIQRIIQNQELSKVDAEAIIQFATTNFTWKQQASKLFNFCSSL